MMATMNDDGKNGRSLPDGWEWKTVNDLAEDIQYGYTQSANDEPVGPKFLRITDIQDGQVNWDTVPYCECSEQDIQKFKLESGDIVFARTGATTGKSFLIRECPDAVFASYLIRLRLKSEANTKYFYYFLQSSDYWSQIMTVKKGSAQPGVNATILATLQLPLAPFSEQERIVSRIEELLSDLDAGVAALERVRVGLKRYKASVLKAVVTGKLLNGKLEIGEDELPEGWKRVALAEITLQIKDADHKMPKPADSNIPYVSTKDFRGDEDIDFENAKHISEEDYKLLTRKIKPELGDILLSRYGTIGQIRKVKTNRPFQASYSIAIIKPLASEVLTDFLVTLLCSEVGQKQMRDNIRASSQPDLGLESIRKFVFPLPPLDEQRRIVAEVERRLSVVGEVESAVEVGLVRAGRLRQSVLRSAFEGRL